ncbi:type I phosphodiesterase/nucleotide pyrophosphatase [hydrothermal vent metagenome]|uniref:Type I phosphodiesterase/nucleotide pyrophosphatase n=1 Tax=hydrothermal vent metagenome TaxID=652676 RepID=A0A3B0XM82_9ZZZZ
MSQSRPLPTHTPLTKKVLLVGWDAADWKVITPLMDAGKMPNLQKFADGGVVGNLSTLYPVLSPMLWTSIATGKRAAKHGIHGFAEPDPATGGVRPVTSLGRKTKAIWNILNQQGLRSNIVSWWPSYPAEPINGVMLSNNYQNAVDTQDKPWPLHPASVHPEHLRKSMAELRVHPAEITGEQILPFVPQANDIDQTRDTRLAGISKLLAECASVHSAATGIMQLEPWDFMAVYYDTIDHFSHGFMKYHPPQLPWINDRDFKLYQNVINTTYEFHDLMLGTLMHLAGEDTTIIIVSDHGFHPDHLRPRELPNEPAGPAEEHRPFGMFAALGPGIKKDELLFGASLLDITPTILTLLGLPVGHDMDGKPLLNALQPVTPGYIDSWDNMAGEDGSHPAELNIDVIDEQEALQQLVDLGYIEEPNENLQTTTENTVRELRYNLARDFFGARKYTEATPLFQSLWQQYPQESRFGLKIFDCQLATHQTKQARKTLELIIERKQHYAKQSEIELNKQLDSHKNNNVSADELNDKELTKLQKLRRNASTNLATLAYLNARLLHSEARYTEALDELTRAEEIQTHNIPALLQTRVEIQMAMHQWAQAIKTCQQILELDPVNPGAQLSLARCYLSQRNKSQQALDAVTRCLGLTYHNPRAHYLCGVALHRLGRSHEARDAFETALTQNPVMPAVHRRLSLLYRLWLRNPSKASEHAALAEKTKQQLADFKAGKHSENPAQTITERPLSASLHDMNCNTSPGKRPENGIVVVSGLPRSGTSMMMQMLEAGGIPILTDSARKADSDNLRGYYEYEPIKKMASSSCWLEPSRGKAVKIIAQLLPHLRQGEHYRVIFMQRPLKSVIASQGKMLSRLNRNGGRLSEKRLAETYLKQIDSVRKTLSRYPEQIHILSINYSEALNNPKKTAEKINRFLGGNLNEQAMTTAVEQSLQNQL